MANEAYFEVSQLVRSADDARRLFVPIRTMAEFVGIVEVAESIGQLLLRWDDPGFARSADQALALLDELHGVFEEQVGGIDPVYLGEVRVPLYALSIALRRHAEGPAGSSSPHRPDGLDAGQPRTTGVQDPRDTGEDPRSTLRM